MIDKTSSRLGATLHRAEKMFGPRDATYTILGIEFSAGTPQLWFPGHRRQIVIQLTTECLSDLVRACYQLAHECIHLLSPTGGRKAPVPEEGLATFFSELYLREVFAKSVKPGLPSYADACGKVRQLLAIDPAIIRNVRAKQSMFHLITVADILGMRPDVPRELAERLTARFVRE